MNSRDVWSGPLRRAGLASWSALGIIALAVVVALGLSAVSGILVPLVVAVLLGIVLEPLAALLRRFRVPPTLSVVLALLVAVVVGAATVTVVVRGFLAQWPEIYRQLMAGWSSLLNWVRSLDLEADVLDRMVGRPPERLRPGGRRSLHPVGDMGGRVPDPVAEGIVGVPVEPPVDERRIDPGHRRADGDVTDAVGQPAPARLGDERFRVPEAIEIVTPDGVVGIHRAGVDRGEHTRIGRAHRPLEQALEIGCGAHRRPIHGWKRPSGSHSSRRASSRAIRSSSMNRAGRSARFSSASWMPDACSSPALIRSVAQATLAASSAGSVQMP